VLHFYKDSNGRDSGLSRGRCVSLRRIAVARWASESVCGLSVALHDPGLAVPGAGAIQKDPQAQDFRTFGRYQAALTADVIAAVEELDLGLVMVGVGLQPEHAVLKCAAESWTDVEAFFARRIELGLEHDGTPQWQARPEARSDIKKNRSDFSGLCR
jgi:hypothetical protein